MPQAQEGGSEGGAAQQQRGGQRCLRDVDRGQPHRAGDQVADQHGFAAAPKSADPQRQRENLDLSGFTLDVAEMAVLDGLDRPDAEMLDADVFGH